MGESETLTLWPAIPSKSNKPRVVVLGSETVVVLFRVVRPVNATALGLNPLLGGGINRSPELTVVPPGVPNAM